MVDEGVIIKTEDDPLSESATLPAVKKEMESDAEVVTKFKSEAWDADCDEPYSADVRQHMSQADTAPSTFCEAWPVIFPEGTKIKSEPGLTEDETSTTNEELGRFECTEIEMEDKNKDFGKDFEWRTSEEETTPLNCIETAPKTIPGHKKVKSEDGLTDGENSSCNEEIKRCTSVKVEQEGRARGLKQTIGTDEVAATNINETQSVPSLVTSLLTRQASAPVKYRLALKSLSQSHSTKKNRFSCEKCLARFKSKRELKQHLRSHSDEKPFSCEKCTAQFRCKSSLTRHHSRTHSGKKQFSCEMCSAQFNIKEDLKSHLLCHSDEKLFSCEKCSARFKTKTELKSHLWHHFDERLFSCGKCSAQFKRKSHLARHSWIHSDEKQFSCEKCSARFKAKWELKSHLRFHSNEKLFSCEKCLARFKTKSNLKQHARSHSHEKPFSCEKCSARFKRKGEVKQHSNRYHSNEKPFSCEKCSAQFKTETEINSHSLSHMD